MDDSDYDRFLKLLYLCNSSRSIELRECQRDISGGFPSGSKGNCQNGSVFSWERGKLITAVGAYCLMPNHFHLLLKEKEEGGISKFLLKLTTGYSMYFNQKYGRNGCLFQGSFKAQFVDNDRYLEYLYAYIHLNPLKLLSKDWRRSDILSLLDNKRFLSEYQFSSYLDFSLSLPREEALILSKEEFPEYFTSNHDFTYFIESFISQQDNFAISGGEPSGKQEEYRYGKE